MNSLLRNIVSASLAALSLLVASSCGNDIPSTPLWEESFGNHRLDLVVDSPSEAVLLDYDWRRHDRNIDNVMFLIVNAETGDTVRNIRRDIVTDERVSLVFGPVDKAGEYHFYYLPFKVLAGFGDNPGSYLPVESAPSEEWLSKIPEDIPVAKVTGYEARTPFDTFYPMEFIAKKSEKEAYAATSDRPWLVFPEDREHPARMMDNIPERWLSIPQGQGFEGTARPNEYYAFQIAVWASKAPVQGLGYEATDLKSGGNVIPSSAVTCFNLEGVDAYGNPFTKNVDVPQGGVQPLWFGVDIPESQAKGTYEGSITVTDSDGSRTEVPVCIHVRGKAIADRGDSEPWRHSRLRWLNSTMGSEDVPTARYEPVTLDGRTIGVLGRSIEVDPSTALPRSISSWGKEVLASPVRFTVVTSKGEKTLSGTPVFEEKTDGHASLAWKAADDEISLECLARFDFDGWMEYSYKLKAAKDLKVRNVTLDIPVADSVGREFMGFGYHAQKTPSSCDGGWDAPEGDDTLWPFDSFWIGCADAGIQCELKGSSYSGPMLNLYHPEYPPSWYNGGKGGFKVRKHKGDATVSTYSGDFSMAAGEEKDFVFSMIVTPVKELDMAGQFTNRYFHDSGSPFPSDEDLESGIRLVNVHHANAVNPYINYPFIAVDTMRTFIQKLHDKGCKVKIYYTLRELSSAAVELWAFRSLGTELIDTGPGTGYSWLQEHLVDGYFRQWYHHFDFYKPGMPTSDAAIKTSAGDSRLYNYYVEGLSWLVRNVGIDGLYLDDVSYDRRTLKRIRRVLEGNKEGCVIDLHSNTWFSRGPSLQYTEFFPYLDKLWFGEGYEYDSMTPEEFLVESSGIPFGLTGDMLNHGGNRWLGMQYGMTLRLPWYTDGDNCDPRPMWKLWDSFGIADSHMTGFWSDHPLVRTTDDDVKATIYIKDDGSALISLGNYSSEEKTVKIFLDRSLTKNGSLRMEAPGIENFQEAGSWEIWESLRIPAKKGKILLVKLKG